MFTYQSQFQKEGCQACWVFVQLLHRALKYPVDHSVITTCACSSSLSSRLSLLSSLIVFFSFFFFFISTLWTIYNFNISVKSPRHTLFRYYTIIVVYIAYPVWILFFKKRYTLNELFNNASLIAQTLFSTTVTFYILSMHIIWSRNMVIHFLSWTDTTKILFIILSRKHYASLSSNHILSIVFP